MSFTDAVRAVLTQYAVLSGRARRAEYWWFTLFILLVYAVTALVDSAAGITLFAPVALLALLVPSISVAVRRLHDTGRSGWWYLISLVPLAGGLVMLVFLLGDSEPGPNRFGPSPKTAPVGYGFGAL